MADTIVLDPFGGSGSTLIACEETDRICHTIELDEKYANVIVERYVQHKEGNEQNVRVVRDGKEIPYLEVKAALEMEA